ncbi:MAG TPA: HEAT repeat domain-containing protein, partial [Fimbriiglobus sp.]|nr:HEAT repeat domain-containing protein [Fimbriiglobus sp.]
MSILRTVCALVAAPALATAAAAQVPAAPPPPAFGVPPAPLVSPFPAVSAPLTPASPLIAPLPAAPDPIGIGAFPPPPGPTTTLWSFLGLSRAQREYRQRAMARTPLGQLRERIQTPLSKLTGGLIPPFPPQTPTLAELQAPGPVGAAAKAKLDRMGAKDRIKAVQYLGTLDCHYWPEAEDALVAALRVDRNEWVRLEAAKTLLKGCCCTKKTITALTMAATCSDADGNPTEKSPRVVAAAQEALNKCLQAVCQGPAAMEAVPVVPEVTPESPRELPRETPTNGTTAATSKPGPAGEEKSSGGLAARNIARPTGKAYYDRIERRPWPEIVAFARDGLANAPKVPAQFALTAGMDLEMSGMSAGNAHARTDRPANLMDLLLGDDPPPAPP